MGSQVSTAEHTDTTPAGRCGADASMMKAITVFPGKPFSVHLAEVRKPAVSDIANGRGVLVKAIRVGVDGTDREINAAEYGAAPEGYDFLVIGHEGFGQVVEVGPTVTELKPGDYVVATVRRPGTSLYDLIGTNDMTTEPVARVAPEAGCGHGRGNHRAARDTRPAVTRHGRDRVRPEAVT